MEEKCDGTCEECQIFETLKREKAREIEELETNES